MDNLRANTEHTALYLWRISKRGHRVHIEDPGTERAYCQVENCGGRALDGRGAEVPAGRRLCQNCADLAGRNKTDFREPDLRVLLGERLAETEPELFPSAGALKSWKRGEPTRPANRSKGRRPKPPKASLTKYLRKPKRSTVKYLRPFNDDLPW